MSGSGRSAVSRAQVERVKREIRPPFDATLHAAPDEHFRSTSQEQSAYTAPPPAERARAAARAVVAQPELRSLASDEAMAKHTAARWQSESQSAARSATIDRQAAAQARGVPTAPRSLRSGGHQVSLGDSATAHPSAWVSSSHAQFVHPEQQAAQPAPIAERAVTGPHVNVLTHERTFAATYEAFSGDAERTRARSGQTGQRDVQRVSVASGGSRPFNIITGQ